MRPDGPPAPPVGIGGGLAACSVTDDGLGTDASLKGDVRDYQDLPLTNKLVKAEALPSGQFFFRGLHNLPTERLEKAFGQCPERLLQAAEQFDAKRCEFGDVSIQLYVLPRIQLTIVIWGQCDEFGARASILFDRTAAAHMPLDALLAAVEIAVDALIKVSEQSS